MDVNKDSYRSDVSRMDIIELGRRREFTDESGGAKVGHGSGGIMLLRAE